MRGLRGRWYDPPAFYPVLGPGNRGLRKNPWTAPKAARRFIDVTKLAASSISRWAHRVGEVVCALGGQDQNFAPSMVPSTYASKLGTERKGRPTG